MIHSEISADTSKPALQDRLANIRSLWRGGVVETVGALRYRDPETYEEWLEARDIVVITSMLSRLSDRQLDRIGLNRATLGLDVETMMEIKARNTRIVRETLEIVEAEERPRLQRETVLQMAAE